jgi:hypothetical protein
MGQSLVFVESSDVYLQRVHELGDLAAVVPVLCMELRSLYVSKPCIFDSW